LNAECIDLAFVDGDHSALGGLTDLVNVWGKLRPGGHLVFDDISHPQHLYLRAVATAFAAAVQAEIVEVDTEHGYGAICFRKKTA
jgi:predicted O-methyltransferase YrrM